MTTVTKENVSTEHLAANLEADVFDTHQDARFAVGRISVNNLMTADSNLGKAYFSFRAKAYTELGIFDQYDCPNGIDIDEDDERSAHFLALKNTFDGAKLVGTVRVISKDKAHPELLPVEHLFNGSFSGKTASLQSAEVSRLIVCQDDVRQRSTVREALLAAATAYGVEQDFCDTYAVVEPHLEKRLQQLGMPVERVADMRYIEKYKTSNIGLRMDYQTFAKRIGHEVIAAMNIPSDKFVFIG